MGAGLRHLPGGLPGRFGKSIVLHGRAQQQVGVPRSGHVAFIQTAGVGKDRACAADGRGLVVHHGHKVVDAAAAHVVGDDIGRLVAGLDLHRIEQRAQRVGLAAADIGAGGAFAVKVIVNVGRGFHRDRVQLVLIVFQQQDHGHQFCQAGRLHRRLAVLFVNDEVCVGVDDIGGLGRDREIRVIARHGGRRGCQPQREQQRRKQRCQAAEKFCRRNRTHGQFLTL